MRPPDLRSDTIFTPLDKRQKSKFTPSETSTSEIRYYLTSWTKGKKTNLLHLRPPHLRSDTSPSPRTKGKREKRQIYSIWDLQIWDLLLFLPTRTKGKKANLLHLRPSDLRLDTPPRQKVKMQKGKFTPSETSRSEISYYFYPHLRTKGK